MSLDEEIKNINPRLVETAYTIPKDSLQHESRWKINLQVKS